MKKMVLVLVSAILLLSSCNTPSGDIEAHSAWVRPTAQGENAAVYLTLHNHSANDDALTGATTNVADMVEIHESKMENDVMQMNMIDSLPIAVDEEIIFKPGGFHIMLVDIKEDLILDEHIGLILHFKNHEDLVVEVHIENTMPDEDHETGEEH